MTFSDHLLLFPVSPV